jgi:tetratricopeptide (TPR) repeat protein
MLSLQRIFLSFLFLGYSLFACGQDSTDDAAANYKAALALVNSGKGIEGIPYLEKLIITQSAYTAAAYSLLGGIYDNARQPEKAVLVYKDGLKAYPTDQSLYFNLGIAYFRAKQYANAELAAIEAIKLDPKHVNSQRLYGLVTFHQNKRVNALLAFCSFLLLEPSGPRSEEALTNMQSILKGGVLKDDGPGKVSPADAKQIAAANAGLATIIASAQAKKLTGLNLLEYDLKNIFILTGQSSAKKTEQAFFDKFYAAYFYQLAQTNNLPAFVRLINSSTNKADYTQWEQDHAQQSADLDNWVKTTARGF